MIPTDTSLKCLEILGERRKGQSRAARSLSVGPRYIPRVRRVRYRSRRNILSATPHETFHRRTASKISLEHLPYSRWERCRSGRGYSDFTHRRPRPAVLPRLQTVPILADAGRGAGPIVQITACSAVDCCPWGHSSDGDSVGWQWRTAIRASAAKQRRRFTTGTGGEIHPPYNSWKSHPKGDKARTCGRNLVVTSGHISTRPPLVLWL